MLARWEVGAQNCGEVNCMLEQVWELIYVQLEGRLCIYVDAHTTFKL